LSEGHFPAPVRLSPEVIAGTHGNGREPSTKNALPLERGERLVRPYENILRDFLRLLERDVSFYDPQDQITVPAQQSLEFVYVSLKNPRYDFVVIEPTFVAILFQVTESAPDEIGRASCRERV